MTIFEKLKTMTLDETKLFWYLNGKNRGLKKTAEFLESEYNSDNCNTIEEEK